MKKLFVMALAAVAVMFTACNNKAQQKTDGEATDSVEAVVMDANQAADEAIAALSEQIEKKDAGALQTALEGIKEKVATFIAANPEIAKEYLGKVQTFLKDNADKIKAVVGDNAAVTSLIEGITNLPTESVDALVGAGDALKALGIDASAKATEAVDGVKDAADEAVKGAKDAADKAVNDAKDAAEKKANEAVEGAKKSAGDAIDKAASDAKSKLGL